MQPLTDAIFELKVAVNGGGVTSRSNRQQRAGNAGQAARDAANLTDLVDSSFRDKLQDGLKTAFHI